MKAIVWHGIGDIRLDDVPEPEILDPHDAIVKITRSAICGTDLHLVRGTMAGMEEGTVLGHEAVGVVTEVGDAVRGFAAGDRVVINSTISCGACPFCRQGKTAQCDVANPNGPQAGTSFFGGPQSTGSIDGLQAEYARVPWAQNTMHLLPDTVSDEQGLLLSDIFPTGWFGAQLAGVSRGDVVVVLGAGIVGQFAAASAFKQGAGRVIIVDGISDRLAQARTLGAEIVDFNEVEPVQTVLEMTNGAGADCVIDAVGVDAQYPANGRRCPDATSGRSSRPRWRRSRPTPIRRASSGSPATHPRSPRAGRWRWRPSTGASASSASTGRRPRPTRSARR